MPIQQLQLHGQARISILYACQPLSGTTPVFKVSPNSTIPYGYTSNNSRKVAGFHCLCVAAGTISGHPATGYLAGDIIPNSVWDLKLKPASNPEGMAYISSLGVWVDIYLASGTSTSTVSVNGGTISDTRTWLDFVDDGAAVKKRLLKDYEFQVAADGSNQMTNITGSADPGTTTGHVDTASRRMISSYFLEDCCGAMWQWLEDQSATPGSVGWTTLPGSKGSIYTYGDAKLRGGRLLGHWDGCRFAGAGCVLLSLECEFGYRCAVCCAEPGKIGGYI